MSGLPQEYIHHQQLLFNKRLNQRNSLEIGHRPTQSFGLDQRPPLDPIKSGSQAFNYDGGQHFNISPGSNNIILISHQDEMEEDGEDERHIDPLEDSSEFKQFMDNDLL